MHFWRPTAIWAAVTGAALAAALAVPGAWHDVRTASPSREVEHLLVAVCALGLALALARLWVITTLVVLGLLRGRAGVLRASSVTRRLVLLACGAAVVTGASLPAVAAGGDGRDLLVGLALPERAVAPTAQTTPREPGGHRTHEEAQESATYVVRPGDSLWSIGREHPDGAASVDQRWRAIWQANRDLVGDDPDQILPGQALRLPTTRTPSSDGDR